MEGKAFGRYRVTEKLAKGDRGVAYAAVHERMGMDAVIKVLLPDMSLDKSRVERFFQEAQAAAHIRHPGIVSIFDIGYSDDDRAYIIMERLRGEPLRERLQRKERMSIEQAVTVMRQLTDTLGAAHERGIVHQDLKPANIVLVPDPEAPGGERVKVLDFGMTRLTEQQGATTRRPRMLFGMPSYMAPEQCADAAEVDHRADLYAMGCLFYACLCGNPPFTGTGADVLAAHLRTEPTPPRRLRPDVPQHLDALIMRLLQKRPEDRPSSCAEVIEALDGRPRPRASVAVWDDDAGLVDTRTAVPQFAETEMCEVIEENADNVSLHAHRGQRRTLRGVPSHYRPPGPSLGHPVSAEHEAPRQAWTAAEQRGAEAQDQEPAPAPRRPSHKTTPGTRRARTTIDFDWSGRGSSRAAADVSPRFPRPSPSLGQPALLPGVSAGRASSQGHGHQDDAERPDTQTTITTSAAQIYWPERGESRRRRLRASATALAALGGLTYGLIAVLTGGGHDGLDDPRAAVAPMLVEVQADVTMGDQGNGPDGDGHTAGHAQCIEDAREAMDREQWDRALALARRAQDTSTDAGMRAEATELETQARRERNSLVAFEQLREAATAGDMTEASTRLGAIPESSVYHTPAVSLMREVWITAQTREARKHVLAGRCDEVAQIAEEIAYVSEDASIAVAEMHASCIEVGVPADATEDATPDAMEDGNEDVTRDGSAEVDVDIAGEEDAARMQTALRAYRAKRYHKVHRLCRKALTARQPDDQRLLALCGMAACRMERGSLARRYHARAEGDRKQEIGAACAREGIDLTSR